MISLQFNNTISERDMDLLFVQAALTNPGFCRMLIDKTRLKGRPFHIINAELSKTDNDLGESDITIVVEAGGKKYGILVEDKIDAIAMPEQHKRYAARGKKAVADGDYDEYLIFIFCPEKYYRNNEEAKLYEHRVTYEECRDFFASSKDLMSQFYFLQFEQALLKAKKPPTSNVDESANQFLRHYISYQKDNYPTLDLSTGEDKNGWWTDFRTNLGRVYINHKIREGYVDLTFPGASDGADRARAIVDWAEEHNISGASVVKTKRSVMIRLHVPKLDIKKGFEFIDKNELNQCLDAVKELTEFANMIETARAIAY